MPTSDIVSLLLRHNETCTQCYRGEPCAVAERIQDEAMQLRLGVRTAEVSRPSVPVWPPLFV